MHILTIHCEDYKISFELLLLCGQNKLTILVCMEMNGNIKFTMEESDKLYLSRMSRLAQIVLSHIGSMCLQHNVMRMSLNSVVLLQKTNNHCLIVRKTSDTPQ